MITDYQYRSLYDFVAAKGVQYTDLQIEIVDHMVCAIEENLNRQNKPNFDAARDQVYQSFGSNGFKRLKKKKEKALKSYWRRRVGSYLLKFFTFPKLVFTGMLTVIYFTLFKTYYLLRGSEDLSLTAGIFLAILIISSFALVLLSIYWENNRTKDPLVEKLLTVSAYNRIVVKGILGGLAWLVFTFLTDFQTPSSWFVIGMSILMSGYTILAYAALKIFPSWLEEEVKRDFPEYTMMLRTDLL